VPGAISSEDNFVLQVALLDKYAVPTGLGNVFLDCSATAILSLTGQNLDYSQVLDDHKAEQTGMSVLPNACKKIIRLPR